MKYKIILLAGFVGALFSCEREMSPEQAEKFIKYYGNSLMDEARDVAILDDGGYAICGVNTVADLGKRMVLIVTDNYGNPVSGFPKYYTEEGLESGANALVPIRGGQGGFLLAGYVERPVVGEDLPATNTQKDMFLVKVSSTGQEGWKKSFGSAEDEVILHATQRLTSGFLLAGYQVTDGKSDILIKGVDEQGILDPLDLNYNNPYAENGSANFLLNTGEQYLCVCTYDKIGGGGTDVLVLNINDDLDAIPENLTDDDSNEYGSCIIEDGEDNFLVLGNRITSSGKIEIVIHQIETSGLLIPKSVLLATISEGNMDLIGERFVKTADGRYAIIGTRQSNGTRDIFLQFLTSDFVASGRIIYGASGDQSGADIDLPSDGGIVILGTSSFENNSMISLIKTSDTGDL